MTSNTNNRLKLSIQEDNNNNNILKQPIHDNDRVKLSTHDSDNQFQRNTLQRKNLKYLTLSANDKTSVSQSKINIVQNNMKNLTINNNNNNNNNNSSINNNTNSIQRTNQQKFHPLRLRRNFNHNLDISNNNSSNSNNNNNNTINLSTSTNTTDDDNAISTSPTSSISSSPTSSISSSPLEAYTNFCSRNNTNNKRKSIISEQNFFNRSNHIQKINITSTTEEVIFNNECVFQLQDLVKLGKIGEGNSGTVTKVLHVPTSKIICKKTIPIEKNNQIINQQLISELSIMKSIKPHQNIITFYGALINHSINDEIVILMEFMDCGSLDKILSIYKKFKSHNLAHAYKTWFNNPMIISKISYGVLTGLAYLYDHYKIIHRDIKPSNVLIDCHGNIKICDFGVSKKMINSMANTFVGTSTYMSPERIQGNVYSTKGDVWSLGLVIIELVTGEFPLGGHNDTPDGILDLLQRIVNESAPCLPINNGVYNFPQEMMDFVNKCCIKDAKLRPSIKELLSHTFILHYNNNNYIDEFHLWCTKIKSKIRKDRHLRKEAIERNKLEKRKLEKMNQTSTHQ